MSIISAGVLFASWVASVILGIVAGIAYLEWVRQQECKAIMDHIKKEIGHVE